MRILKKLTLGLFTALIVQSVAVTGTVITTSAYQTNKTQSQAKTQQINSSDAVYGDFEYTVSDNKVTITKYTGSDTSVVIPSEIDGMPVTCIGSDMSNYPYEEYYWELESLTIPDSITEFGYIYGTIREIHYLGSKTQWQQISNYEYISAMSINFIYGDFEYVDNYNYYGGMGSGLTITKYNGNETSVVIPSEIDGEAVTAIDITSNMGDDIFTPNMLESLTIPTSITKIGSLTPSTTIREIHYLGSMTQWQHIDGSDYIYVEKIYYIHGDFEYTYKDYSEHFYSSYGYGYVESGIRITKYNGNATHLVIPSEIDGMAVRGICSYTFNECTTVESITIPETVQMIENDALYEPYTEPYTYTLSDVYYIGTYNQWLQICENYSSLYMSIPNIHFQYEDFEYSCNPTGTYSYSPEIRITRYNGNETSVVIPSEIEGIPVTCIGSDMPQYPYEEYYWELESLTIPTSITKIGGFSPNTTIREIHYLGSMTQWQQIDGNSSIYSNIIYYTYGDFEYTVEQQTYYEQPKAKITKYTGTDSNVIIPSYIGDTPDIPSYYSLPVKTIGAYAFEGRYLDSITIPMVTTIEPYAFNYCNLNDVYYVGSQSQWNELTADTSISAMFENATIHFKILTYGDFEYIIINNSEIAIIQYTGNDEQVVIPQKIDGIPVRHIGSTAIEPVDSDGIMWTAFSWCESLKSVVIPDGVINIGTGAFAWCTNLTNITIPDSVTYIGELAFNGCSKLTGHITISDSMTNIGTYTFAGCSSLTSITIPNSVTAIYPYAFNGCNNLKVYYTGTEEQWRNINDFGVPQTLNNLTVYYNCPRILLDKEELNLETGEMYTLSTAIIPETDTEVTYTFKSNNTAVATVNKAGRIVARGEGSATITVTASNGMKATCTVNVSQKETLTLDKTELNLSISEMYTLTSTLYSGDTTVTYTFKSNNTAVATVNSSGRIVARGEGVATITVIASNGLKATCTVTVTPQKTLTLDKTDLSIGVSEMYTLAPILTPADDTVTYTFKSNNTAVATVNSSGRVVARGEGIATITVIASNGLKATCTVTVTPQKTLTLDKTELSLNVSEMYTLAPILTPADDTVTYTFKSNNTSVATVNKAGRIVARGTGTATITVKSSNGLTAVCEVIVQ